MPYDVSSWFIEQTRNRRPTNIVRKFLIGTSDYSDRVVSWPTIQRVWDEPKSVALTVNLNNQDRQFNDIYSDPVKMRNECEFQMGFTHPTSGDELISLYTGTITRVRYNRGRVSLALRDKFKQFSERTVGDRDNPAVFSGGTFLPSDVAWAAITSYGGFSSIQSDSNPDINWETFQTWAAVFSGNSVFMDARFEGQKTTQVLRKIARYTQSAIFIEENRLSFSRFSSVISGTQVTSLGPDELTEDFAVELDDSEIINKQWCWGAYNVESRDWGIQVFDSTTASINSYGLREEVEKDQNVWYVSSASAIDFSQRVVQVYDNPPKRITNAAGLQLLPRQIGEAITVVDSFMQIDETFRVMEYKISMETGMGEYRIDNTQTLSPFILDTSTLDNTIEVLA